MLINAQPFSSNGAVASAVIKTTKGRLCWLALYNNNASNRYAMLFDATVLPGNGTAPLLMQSMTATSSVPKELAFPPEGMPFVNGLVIAISSTPLTLTLAGADLVYTAGIA